jgi:CO/xanthine dehydrogenase FAD-binding subunit
MIPHDLVYLRPQSTEEALEAFDRTRSEGLEPMYYAGGSEILSLSRRGRMRPGALIDIKQIPRCRGSAAEGDHLYFGAALSLNELVEGESFPLLAAACRRVADHSVRNRLTLGGNICGRLPYREAVLPLLVAEAEAEIASAAGSRWQSLNTLFSRRLRLEPGELLVRLRIPRQAASHPFAYGRRQQGTRVDYPLVTCCLMNAGGTIRLAVTGACGYPIRDGQAESLLSDGSRSWSERVEAAVAGYTARIRDDFRASAEYRAFLLSRILEKAGASLLAGKVAE